MNDLDWIRGKLNTYEIKAKEEHLTTQQFVNKRAFRENILTGKETMDYEGFTFTEWEGLFLILTGRKPTQEEFISYSDWIDNYKKEPSLSIYDNLKVWFDKNRIEMLPKTKEVRHLTNEDIDKRIHFVLEKIERIRKEKEHDLQTIR